MQKRLEDGSAKHEVVGFNSKCKIDKKGWLLVAGLSIFKFPNSQIFKLPNSRILASSGLKHQHRNLALKQYFFREARLNQLTDKVALV